MIISWETERVINFSLGLGALKVNEFEKQQKKWRQQRRGEKYNGEKHDWVAHYTAVINFLDP